MLGILTLRDDRWQEARLFAREAAGSRPHSPSASSVSRVALGRRTRYHRYQRPECRPRVLAEIVDAAYHAGDCDAAPMTVPQPSYYPGVGVVPPGTRVELGLFDTITESVFGHARSGHLAAAAVLDALQRGLERGLGAVAQRFGRRTATGLDQCRGRQHVPAVVLHVRPGVQPGPEEQRLPRCLHTLHAAQPSPAPDHEHPLRAPQQRWRRVTHHRPDRADAAVEEPHDIRRYLVHAPRLAARDERLLAHGRGRGAGPDRQPAPRGEDRPDPGRRLLEQFRGPLGDPGRDR